MNPTRDTRHATRIILPSLTLVVFASAALAANSGEDSLQTQIAALKEKHMMRTRRYTGLRHIGMTLSRMGKAPAMPLAKLLDDEKRDIRWGAAVILEMIGIEADAALPALQRTFRNEDEDIGVRVSAARAIAAITKTNVFELYATIPRIENKIIAMAKERSLIAQNRERWMEHLVDPELKSDKPRHLHLYKKTPELERALYGLAVGEGLEEHNQWLRQYTANLLSGKTETESHGGSAIDEDLNAFLFLFGAKSRQFPGRLQPDVEKAIKQYVFLSIDESKAHPRYQPKTSADLEKILACGDSAFIMEVGNGPARSDANHYLILQTLHDDPAYTTKKFRAGDTVLQRYEKHTEFYRRGLKQWALHGLFIELGSGHYEYKTYRGLFNLYDFASDPVVRQRIKMYLDLAMVEIAQIWVGGVRGGSKSRAKEGGFRSRFDRIFTWLLGEHHGYNLEPPGLKGYQPPVPAVLLLHLGPTEPIYEIANRHPGEEEQAAPEGIRQYDSMHRVLSRSINYAYRTPDYITGCSMFDVSLWFNEDGGRSGFGYGPLGRWSGVIFRDRGAVWLEAYTGEKWNVQHKDVMIAQRYKHAHYKGDARVDFTPGWDMVEKDGWVFVSNEEAYAAVRIVKGRYDWKEPAQRLMLKDQYSPIIIQTGRQANYGTFEKFQKAILNAPYKLTEEKLEYKGPNSPTIEFFLSDKPYILPKIDGKTLNLDLKHNYRSPYLQGTVGSDVVTVRYGGRAWEYDFGKNEVRRAK